MADLAVGSDCIYRYKGPWGFSLQPDLFAAKVLGFTPRGMVRIEAFDHINLKTFRATVWRRSLQPTPSS